MDKKLIGILIQEEITRMELTKISVVKESGVVMNTLNGILSGEKDYRIDSLMAICKTLKIKIKLL